MRTVFVQFILVITSLVFFAMNSPVGDRGPFQVRNLRIHATGVDFYFHSGLAPQSFDSTNGIGFLYEHTNGDLYLFCIGKCVYSQGLTRTGQVEISMFRGSLYVEGIDSVTGEVGSGDVEFYDVKTIELQIGRGEVNGTVLGQSEVDIDLIHGDIKLQVPHLDWKVDIQAPITKLDVPYPSNKKNKSMIDGIISMYVHNGSCEVRTSAPLAYDEKF